MDPLALLSCDAAASAGTWRLKPPAAHVALGGSQAAPRSPSQCQSPSSVHSVCLPSQPANHIIYRTAVYGPVRTVVWEGRSREAPPYPDPIFIDRGAPLTDLRHSTPGYPDLRQAS